MKKRIYNLLEKPIVKLLEYLTVKAVLDDSETAKMILRDGFDIDVDAEEILDNLRPVQEHIPEDIAKEIRIYS